MNKIKFLTSALCTISIAANFSACGKNANTHVSATAGAEAPEVILTSSDTYSETPGTQTEIPEKQLEILSQKSEKTQITEKYPEIFAEMPERFSEIERKILYDDGENVFTAGEYMASILNSGLLPENFGTERDMLQLADIDGNGIPELIAIIHKYNAVPAYSSVAEIISVSPDGKAEILHDSNGGEYIDLEDPLEPYISDGKTVWVSEYSVSGYIGSSRGNCFVSIDGNTVKTETIRHGEYHKDSDFEYQEEYYWHDELVSSYEEYEILYDDFINSMNCSVIPCPYTYVNYKEETAVKLCDLVNRYIDSVPKVYSEVYDEVIYDDGENVLTAGKYIDALVEYRPFSRSFKNGIQLADIDGNGIPEAVIRTAAFPITSYIAVSPEGKAELLYDMEGNSEICGDMLEPYELNGKTVWLTDFYIGGSVSGGGGDCFVTIDGNMVKTKIIRNYEYGKNLNTFEYIYNYYWNFSNSERKYDVWDSNNRINDQTSTISEEEYESRYEELLSGMEESAAASVIDRVYGGSSYSFYELPDLLANMLIEYHKLDK